MSSEKKIDKGQLIGIFICICLITLIATFTLGILIVYVVRLGADEGTAGIYLATGFFTVTIGNMIGGWLTDRIGQRKRVTLISYVLWIPAALLSTQATTVTGVILTTGLMWLIGGVAVATLNSLMGLSAGESERGHVFGLIGLAGNLGGLIVGLFGGQIADRWGFIIIYVLMAVLVGVMFIVTVVLIHDVDPLPASHPHKESHAEKPASIGVGTVVWMLLLANLLARLGTSPSDLGRPLIMLKLGLDTTAVGNAIAVSSAVTLPLPFIMGRLSDRIGRKRLLILCFGVAALGVLLLTGASLPWHFWLVAALTSLVNATGGVGQAYIADLTEAKSIGRSLSLYNSSNFISGMIGLGGAGYVIHAIGVNAALIVGACLIGTSIVLLLRMRSAAPKLVVDLAEATT